MKERIQAGNTMNVISKKLIHDPNRAMAKKIPIIPIEKNIEDRLYDKGVSLEFLFIHT